MAEEAVADGISEDLGDEGVAETPSKGRGLAVKKLVLFVVLPLLLLGGGGAGAYFMGLLDPLLGKQAAHGEGEETVEAAPTASIYYDLPELLVNLNTGSRKSNFLKISVALELDDEATIERLQTVMPRIIDNFQVYLRELRIEDLSGSAGIERLREELLLRVNAAIRPAEVRDVLFKEMLVQ